MGLITHWGVNFSKLVFLQQHHVNEEGAIRKLGPTTMQKYI